MTSEDRFTGTVIWFDNKKGYGFVEWLRDGVKQKDIFAHFSHVVHDGFKSLEKEQEVTFSLGKNKRGEVIAVEITVVKALK